MENTDPLSQLKDIHLPDPVGLWPLAWGWWVLLALIVISIITGIYLWRRHRARNHYRQLALIELQNARAQVDQDGELAHYLQQVSIILRRAALTGLPARYHANLKGEAWLQWLDAQSSGADEFGSGAGRALLTGPYEAHPSADIESLHQLAAQWIAQHRNQWQSPAKDKQEKQEKQKNQEKPEALHNA